MRVARFVTCLADAMFPQASRSYRSRGDHPAGHPALIKLLVERLEDYRAQVHSTAESGIATAVSGPSATSDIELDGVDGVRGPRKLHLMIV